MSVLSGFTVAEFNDRPKVAATVAAKKRKRCVGCGKMVEVGEQAVLTDDRYAADRISQNHGGAQYNARLGSWHLWHPACHAAVRGAAR